MFVCVCVCVCNYSAVFGINIVTCQTLLYNITGVATMRPAHIDDVHISCNNKNVFMKNTLEQIMSTFSGFSN